MVAMLTALLFSAAFMASVWSIWITVAPRLDYMRALIAGDVIEAAPAPVPVRVRTMSRPAPRSAPLQALRAAA